jgi:hypothetical protein
MLRILTLDWTKVPESEKAKAQGRLLRYIAAHGGMLSEDNAVFVTEDLDKVKGYEILKRVFTLNNIAAYEHVNIFGFDGAGRVF